MTFEEIRETIETRFPGAVESVNTESPEHWALIRAGEPFMPPPPGCDKPEKE